MLVSKWGYVSCEVALTRYRFNLRNNRFLAAYLEGYTDGANDNKNTPYVAAGMSTKIE